VNPTFSGMIGYLLEQEINHALGDVAKQRGVVTLLSQIIVDPNDNAFDNPTKFVGPVYSKEEAMKLGKPVKPDGKYYRQVVPSPMPVRLIDEQLTAVKLLTCHDVIVICAGGGGIPVVFQDGRLKGIEAVIDKDRAACMMGKTLGADGLMILTDVHGVAINHGTADETWIKSASPQQMLALEDNFPDGSMGPKVSSAIDFVQNGGWSMIGSLKDASKMLDKEAGTEVTNDHGEEHLEFY
jgi:carbamate kinase